MSEESVQGNTESGQGSVVQQQQAQVPPAIQPAAPPPEPTFVQPQAYTDFSIPEGVNINQDALKKFIPLAKQLGADQETAQSIIDIGVELVSAQQQQQQEGITKMREQWVNEISGDPEIGGEKLEEHLNMANNALKAIDPNGELGKILKSTGLGDHPAMIRSFVNLAKKIGDDSLVTGGTPANALGVKNMYENSPELK